jgi:N-lysine methyltransferase SETD6
MFQWNTYGDLPNSDLLRRYGHVDLVALPGGGEGNPADVVEIPASLVVTAILSSPRTSHSKQLTESPYQERIDWWLDEAGDE